ncbi:MAG: LacI family DNA-binding transcriptional regulator [Bryobacteraceae bacterium]
MACCQIAEDVDHWTPQEIAEEDAHLLMDNIVEVDLVEKAHELALRTDGDRYSPQAQKADECGNLLLSPPARIALGLLGFVVSWAGPDLLRSRWKIQDHMKEIARKAGVSVGTVSNVLWGLRSNRREIRKRVDNATRRLDDHPN